MIITTKMRVTYQKESIMDNTPNERIMSVEKKVYTTPELIEHGTLSEITNSGTNLGPEDATWIFSSTAT
jgi:hypothetical protein